MKRPQSVIVIPPPPETEWCRQCDQRRVVAQILACKSRFCPLDVKP